VILVLGLGNPLRRDDAVGHAVIAWLARDPPPGAELRVSSAAGLRLLDELEGFAEVVLVDAAETRAHPAGAVFDLDLADLPPRAAPTAHAVGLPTALAAARAFGAAAPVRVRLVAVEALELDTVGDTLTPAVAAAVPVAAARVRALIAAARSTPAPPGSTDRASAAAQARG
jgi:hydrogenase maturation protease